MAKDHAAREKVLASEAQRLNREYANAVQQAHAQHARADMLQAQLNQLKDLPAALESVLRKAAVPLPAKRAPRKTSARKKRADRLRQLALVQLGHGVLTGTPDCVHAAMIRRLASRTARRDTVRACLEAIAMCPMPLDPFAVWVKYPCKVVNTALANMKIGQLVRHR